MDKAPVSARLNRHLAADLTEPAMAQAVVRTMTPERSVVLPPVPAEIFIIHKPATVQGAAWGQPSTETAVFTTAIPPGEMSYAGTHAVAIHIATPVRVLGAIPTRTSV